ncbi:MAG: DNA integrity scanning protein DisA nucleotide-binding domain protein, partial [Bacteroidales bacterium]|nr:DNA integrity scanning protein DisA nucleotide-binding domain protein [Bacteroidales bacterium]
VNIDAIVNACSNMSAFKTGALIAISKKSDLLSFIRTGDTINADTSSRLLENIFFKNSPLHDGAVIIKNDKIAAARCVLPTTDRIDLPPQFGMRHRAALGIAERTDAVVILVSEETGAISFAKEEKIETNIGPNRLRQILEKEFSID